MRLSKLQKYIVVQALEKRGRLAREGLLKFYQPSAVKLKDQQNIITKSILRLIEKGLLIGYGKRTPEKWFITEIKLTNSGKKQAEKIWRAKQQKLPLK